MEVNFYRDRDSDAKDTGSSIEGEMNLFLLCLTVTCFQLVTGDFCLHANENLMQIFGNLPTMKSGTSAQQRIREIPEEFCPTVAPEATSVNDNSLCSWNYTLNHDPDRYPHDILEAQCMCSTCIGGMHRCMPIVHEIPVVRQVCEEGTYTYYWHMETISVGCACSHAKTRVRRGPFWGV